MKYQARKPCPHTKLGQVAVAFKHQITKHINRLQNTPGFKIWQRGYYDHIIRNDKSLNRIREYIINNPATWDTDENNINNHKLTVQAGLDPTRQF